MIIRFCLSLASKSASAYDELRNSNVLTLPSRRTLRDYKNAVKPHAGFNPAVINELKKQVEKLKDHQRKVVISLDEMKIQENLVYDKYSGNLVGFVDLGDPDLNYAMFSDTNALATHVMVFYLRGISSDLKFELGYFGTKGMCSYQIFSRFWCAVRILERSCHLQVIAAVADGASSNRAFIKMHEKFSGDCVSTITYRAENFFNPGKFIYFFADAPHLMKTTRNCMYHSGEGKKRYMWNNGDIIWSHLTRLVDEELALKRLPKLTTEHVKLNSYSSMKVSLATQILSESVGKVLTNSDYYPGTFATGKLCLMMDKFFDIMNIRNKDEWKLKRKENLKPFKDINDIRFLWLKNDFINYFLDWKNNIESRSGTFEKTDRSKMFISQQTFEGLMITAHSVVECVQFLLGDGLNYVLTERFSQDVLEENFGRHRAIGRRNDNPSLHQFGYDSNGLRIARSVVPVQGNTKGKHTQKRVPSWSIVDNESIPKRKCASRANFES